MGCTSVKSQKISQRMGEFDTKNAIKIIEENNKEIILNLKKNNLGEFFNEEISNEKYFYFEKRFSDLVKKELQKKKSLKYDFQSKKEFIENILENQKMRKKILSIIKRKGIKHSYRWSTWQILQNYNKKCIKDQEIYARREKMYPLLCQLYNEEVESIVNKDVIRTARHKELFKEMNSLGCEKLWKVCKAVGCFFKDIGYLQGMNFVVAFILEISAMEEFETFNFLINFWKKEKNLYFGMYAEGFPMISFFKFAFHYILGKEEKIIQEKLFKMDFPDELWITKWFLSFFTFSLNKEFVLRIFDFLMINDCLGLVYVALLITYQLKKYILTGSLASFNKIVQNHDILSKKLNFYKFVKKLKTIYYSNEFKLKILLEYNNSLDIKQKENFNFYFLNLKKHWMMKNKKFYDDFEIIGEYKQDYDSISLEELDHNAKSSIYLKKVKEELNQKEETLNKETKFFINRKMNDIVNIKSNSSF
jgi:hypothetical protein